MNICTIDGRNFDALVTAIEETFEKIEGPNSGTALHNQRKITDLIGIKIGHKITFDIDKDPVLFDELTEYLFGTLRPSVMLEAVHNQKTIIYEAEYTTGARRVSHIDEDGTIYWGELTVTFFPLEPQITE